MAINNIQPYTALGAGGGTLTVQWMPLAHATNLLPGEPYIMSGGKATEAATDPTTIQGICGLYPVNGFSGAALNYPLVSGLNPDRVVAIDDSVPCIATNLSQQFITSKIFSDATTAAAPTAAHVGTAMSYVLASGVWGLRISGGSNLLVRVDQVLDAQGRALGLSFGSPAAGTGVYVVFHQITGF